MPIRVETKLIEPIPSRDVMIDLLVRCFRDAFHGRAEVAVDADTDFFRDLGGDSLAALELSVLVEERAGIRLLDDVFQASTPRSLTELVTARLESSGKATVHRGLD